MIIVKSDGGKGYNSTDMEAINYRVTTLKADWLIYIVAIEQSEHFKILFKAGEIAGFYKPGKVRLDHMGYDRAQGADGKKYLQEKEEILN